jgi:hypothetical protein
MAPPRRATSAGSRPKERGPITGFLASTSTSSTGAKFTSTVGGEPAADRGADALDLGLARGAAQDARGGRDGQLGRELRDEAALLVHGHQDGARRGQRAQLVDQARQVVEGAEVAAEEQHAGERQARKVLAKAVRETFVGQADHGHGGQALGGRGVHGPTLSPVGARC